MKKTAPQMRIPSGKSPACKTSLLPAAPPKSHSASRPGWIVTILTTLLALIAVNGFSIPRTWSGGSTWPTPGNWTPAGIPTPFDDANFTGGGTPGVNLNNGGAGNTADNLNFSGATSYYVYDDYNLMPSFSETLTIGTAISQTGTGTAQLANHNITSPLLTVNSGGFEFIGTNLVALGTANINGGIVCIMAWPPSSISSGAWNVNGGLFKVSGQGVVNPGTAGSLIGPVNMNGGVFQAGCSVGTANLIGNLTYGPAAATDFELGTPNIVGVGVNDLINVEGNLTLDGTINVVPQAGFGSGVYRLFNYSGAFVNSGVVIGSAPSGYILQLDFSTTNQVNLIVASTNCCPPTNSIQVCYTNTIYPGFNYLVNPLCPGTSGVYAVPELDASTVFRWDEASQTYEVVATYDTLFGGWVDAGFNPTVQPTFNKGETYVFYNPYGTSFQWIFCGVAPTCPPPCLTNTTGFQLVGRLGIGVAYWTNLSSCPPTCGTEVRVWNPVAQFFVSHFFGATGWTPSAPVIGIGQSAFVKIGTDTNCLPCTNNLVINGSFEAPYIGANTVSQSPTIPGWTATDAGNSPTTLELWSGNFFNMIAQDGYQHLEINSATNNVTVSQVITNVSTNCPARFCFWYAGRAGHAPNNFQVEVLGSGLTPVTLNPQPYDVYYPWTQYCVDFTPVSTTLTIRFTGTSGAALVGAHIDNVTLTQCCDTNPPCNEPLTVYCSTNKTVQCGTAWQFDPPVATSPCCPVPPTVSEFFTWTNGSCTKIATRIWQITDCYTNTTTCTQTVTLVDTVAPVINCVPNKTVQCNQSWQFDTPTAFDNCSSNLTVSLIASNMIQFNPPCSIVYRGIWQAVDSCGNSTTCTQLVTVADTIAPTLCCPNDMTFTTCSNSVVVNFKVKVTDNCSTALVPVSTPPSGSSFPVGTTIVTNTATDACGNVATCTFKVTVKAGVTTTKTITIGNVDCFSTINTDYTPRSPALNSLGGLTTFDANPFPGSFGASFLGLPTSISCARLEIRMRPYTGNTNTAFYDKISLGLTNTSGGGQFAWTNNIGNQGSGGGLIPTSWDFGQPACGRTFYINLQSLIPLMSSSHKLDILVRSNTFVDYARLCYCYCASKPVWKGFELDLSNMTLYRACDDIIIVKGTGPGTATFGSAVGQTAGVSLGFEPISFVSAVDGLTFRGQRVSGASPNHVTVSGDGAGGMEFRSAAVRSNVTQIVVTLYNGNNAVSQSTLAWSPTALIANTAAGAKLVQASVSENGDKQTFKLEAPALMGIGTNTPVVADSIAIKFVGAQDVAGDMVEGYFFDTEIVAEIALNDVSVQTGTLETRVAGDAITAVSGGTTTVTSMEQSTNSVTGLTLPVPNKPILIGPVLDGCNGWFIDRWLDVRLTNVGNVKFTGVSNTWDIGCTFPVINSTNGVRYQVLNAGTVVADSGVIPVTAANVSELPSSWSFSTNTAQGIVQMNWAETALFTINGNSTAGDELRLIPLGSNLPTPVFNTMTIESVGIEAITVSAPSPAGPWTLLPLQLNGNSVTIQWTGPTGGILESAPTVLGPWTTVPNQMEFQTIKPRTTAPAEFFRVRSN